MKIKLPFQKVKIIATIADRPDFEDYLRRLLQEGADIMRLNCSHLEPASLKQLMSKVRRLEKKWDVVIPMLIDLPGPKITIGYVAEGTSLKAGKLIKIVGKPVAGSNEIVSVNYPSILKKLEKGANIYLGDGKLELEVVKKEDSAITAKVITGGVMRSHIGFSAHGLSIDALKIPARDKAFLEVASAAKADFVALSFVQRAKDVMTARRYLPKEKGPFLISKIETPGAIEDISNIIKCSDGIMVARGDLGLALPIAELPHMQKKLIYLSLKYQKPVITATQMLESMVSNRFPTRAEISDVANAVLDGTDAVMLSAETAVGQYPDTTVKTMTKIIHGTATRVLRREFPEKEEVAEAVANSVVKVAKQVKAKAIVAFTESGSTVRLIARHRPRQTILAMTSNRITSRQLVLSWGVFVSDVKDTKNLDTLIKMAHREVKTNPAIKLKSGDHFVISAGVPFAKSGTTNLILVQKVA